MFQTLGLDKESPTLSSCRQGIIYIPLVLLMNHLFGLYGLSWSQTVSDGITLII